MRIRTNSIIQFTCWRRRRWRRRRQQRPQWTALPIRSTDFSDFSRIIVHQFRTQPNTRKMNDNHYLNVNMTISITIWLNPFEWRPTPSHKHKQTYKKRIIPYFLYSRHELWAMTFAVSNIYGWSGLFVLLLSRNIR